MTTLAHYRQKINVLKAQYDHADEIVQTEKKALARAEQDIEHAEEAQRRLQLVAEAVQKAAHEQLATVVSRCLSAVLDRPYVFSINFEKKRGKTEANLHLERDGMILENPIEECGGGVLDVAGFANRVSNLMMSKPPLRRALALDEPLRNLSPTEKYAPKVEELLFTLSKELGIQFIIATNRPEYALGKVYRL